MKHYEKRLEQDEQDIRDNTAAIAAMVGEALKNAVHAVRTGNHKLANLTVLGDGEINRAVRAIDRDCHRFIVRHLPSAGHLRLMSATIRAVIALERIGDYAVSIARVATRLSAPPDQHLAAAVENMAAESGEMLERAMQAFVEGNAEQAKAIKVMADQVERLRAAHWMTWRTDRRSRSTDDLFAMFSGVQHARKGVGPGQEPLRGGGIRRDRPDQGSRRSTASSSSIATTPAWHPWPRPSPGTISPTAVEYESAALTPAPALDPDMVHSWRRVGSMSPG